MESQSKIIDDAVISDYINRLGQNIADNSDSHLPFTFKVIDSDDLDAFALPGNLLYVNVGLILAADIEVELAGVIAHEIVHVAACQAARQNARQPDTAKPLNFVDGPLSYVVYEGRELPVPLMFLRFTRGFDAQADYLGVQYRYKAGSDPRTLISFSQKVHAQEKKKLGTIP